VTLIVTVPVPPFASKDLLVSPESENAHDAADCDTLIDCDEDGFVPVTLTVPDRFPPVLPATLNEMVPSVVIDPDGVETVTKLLVVPAVQLQTVLVAPPDGIVTFTVTLPDPPVESKDLLVSPLRA